MFDAKDIALYNALRKKYISAWLCTFALVTIAVIVAYVHHIESMPVKMALAAAFGFTALATTVTFVKYPKASLCS